MEFTRTERMWVTCEAANIVDAKRRLLAEVKKHGEDAGEREVGHWTHWFPRRLDAATP
jgi:hypothetical protein